MKILTLVGTRPELIRLSLIIKKLDKLVKHIFVYTNQNYDYNLSTIFFKDMDIRQPDYYFIQPGKSFASFLSNALLEFENILNDERPDKILVLGDTNTGLLTLLVEKYKIPIYHMEAGNRCFDKRVPEETNRRLIDHLSTYNLPYTENSKYNLLNEGFDRNHVFKIGNPIYEVLEYYKDKIYNSDILGRLCVAKNDFVLVTAHRAENMDNLLGILNALNYISEKFPVVFPVHPRTASKIGDLPIDISSNILIRNPLGFFDFVKLEQTAKLVISDSGTVQEECCIFGVPSLTIRESTERHETIECGSNILVGTYYSNIISAFDTAINRETTWKAPDDYRIKNVSDIVINILLGKV